MNKKGIKNQVLYLVLGCSIITLIVAGSLALYGMLNIKSKAVDIGIEIGETAAQSSSEALKKVSVDSLKGLTHERSKQINNFFEKMRWEVQILADEMNDILQNPQNYSLRAVSEPDRINAGIVIPQLQYRAGVNRAALSDEISLTANLQDFQVRFFEGDDTTGSIYVASVNGFNITVDKSSDRRVDENNIPVTNDYSPRPWYIKAMQEQQICFSDVFSDARGRGLGIGCASPYFNSNGEIAGIVGAGKFLTTINEIVRSTKIGESGIAFVMNNKTGQVIFSSKDEGIFTRDNDTDFSNDPSLFDNSDENFVAVIKDMAAGNTDMKLTNINGESFYLAYTPLTNSDWSFAIAMAESEVSAPAEVNKEMIESSTNSFVGLLNDSIKLMIITMLIAFLVIMALVPFAGNKVAAAISKPILTLSDGVREIASGNLDKKLEIHTGNEIEHLAVCFNAMTDELKTYMNNLTKITAEKERIATELSVATNIQLAMLPKDFNFNRSDFEIFATMNAAKEVGGDFYDFYLLDEDHLVITMADVSGKGIPAALFMATSKTILKNFATFATNADDYAAVISCANNQLCADNSEMMFVTVFFGVLEISTGKFIFVNGGHNPPIVYHAKDNTCEYLQVKKNFVLGAMEDMNFKQQEIYLEKGDFIFTYTDGVNEAMNINHEEYTAERLLDFMNKIDCNAPLPELLKNIRADVAEHVGDADQSDDITMLALRLN